MAVDSLRALLVDELVDLLDAENQLTKALPKMAAAATSPQLRNAFEKHLQETRGQIARLEKAFEQLGERARRKTCEAMKGLLTEGDELMKETPEGALRDAVMITAAQKVEHYEMASYGCVRTYAEVLGEGAVARLMQQTLREEKAADGKLTTIAEGGVNEDAAEEWSAQQEDEGLVERSSAWIGAASQQLASGARRAASSMGLAQERPASRGRKTSRSSKSTKSTRKQSTSRSRKRASR